MSEFGSEQLYPYSPPPVVPPALAGVIFRRAYSEYADSRDALHEIEQSRPAPQIALNAIRSAREDVAEAASFLQRNTQNTDELLHFVRQATLLDTTATETLVASDAFEREYATPVSRYDTSLPSPIEAIVATTENTEIAQKFADTAKDSLTGLLLSGSTAWGAYFAPRGDKHLRPDRKEGDRSDTDMIAVAKDIEAIGTTIEKYVAEGLVDPEERERFAVFEHLHATQEAEVYSLRATYQDGEQSIHFMTEDTIASVSEAFAHRTREHDGKDIHILLDFRPNLPMNPIRNGKGYSIHDLKGLYNGYYMPSPIEIAQGEKAMGYVTDSPVGSIISENGELTYSMGLMDFFMAITPKIVLDSDGKMKHWVEMLQRTIARVQDGVTPTQIPRAKRMPRNTIHRIQEELTRQ